MALEHLFTDRMLAGSILLEARPVWCHLTIRTHGIQRVEAGSSLGRRVVVHEIHPLCFEHEHRDSRARFETWVGSMGRLSGDPVPPLRGAYGREGRVCVLAFDRIEGTTLAQVYQALPSAAFPVNIALAIVHALVPLCRRADRRPIVLISRNVWLMPDGRLRAWPTMRTEYMPDDPTTDPLEQDIGWCTGLARCVLETVLESRSKPNVYNTGLLLHELLTGITYLGHPPMNVPLWFHHLYTHGPRPIGTLRRGLPAAVARFVDQAVTVAVHNTLHMVKTGQLPAQDALEQTIGTWDELDQHLAALRAELPPVGPSQLAAFADSLPVVRHAGLPLAPSLPPAAELDRLPDAGYEPVPWPT